MLYSIIPPILIVISLAGIIIFLVKKAPAVTKLEENNLGEKKATEKKGFLARFKKGENNENKKDFNHKTLLFLEKITKKSKVFFLKLENIFTVWGESFRNKRNAREKEKIVHLEEIVKEKNILEKEKFDKNTNSTLKDKKIKEKSKKEKRDIFEKILVERIATNPKDIEAYERLGEYYLEIENLNYAKECFKQVLKLNPQNIGVKNKMRKLEKMLVK